MDWNNEEPLAKVKCSSYDCEQDLHCFRRSRPRRQSYRSEVCVACGARLVDWQRLDQCDLKDVEHTFESLGRELIRHHYWHKTFDRRALNHAKGKGVVGLRDAAEHRLRHYVGKPSSQLYRDGTQTPWEGNVIYYAQHATATCCRKCIEIWHGVDRERSLTEREIEYMTELVMRYIQKRLPELPLVGPKTKRRKPNSARIGKE